MRFRKISIITPSLNRVNMLKNVIQNVMLQDYPNFEHIVIDGGSTDGTQDMVREFPHVRFVCAPDQGMYDALNKGLDMATGEIIGFLNTDDLYADNTFSDVAAEFADESVMAVAGHGDVFYEPVEGKTEIIDRYSPEERTLLECSTIGSNYFNAWLFRVSVFKEIGKFNIQYRIAGDREFMLRFALNNLHYVVINRLVYRYRQHPGSLTFDSSDQKREWSVRDHLLMTDSYLHDEHLSSLTRKLLIQLRTQDTIDITLRMTWALDFRKSAYYFVEGIRYDFLWPLKFVWQVFLTVIKLLARLRGENEGHK
jgi:glycosyltransferase involved in cell wall biosynthesis